MLYTKKLGVIVVLALMLLPVSGTIASITSYIEGAISPSSYQMAYAQISNNIDNNRFSTTSSSNVSNTTTTAMEQQGQKQQLNITSTINVVKVFSLLKEFVKVPLYNAVSTAQQYVNGSNSTAFSAHLGIVNNTLVYEVIVLDGYDGTVHLVAIDAGNGKVIHDFFAENSSNEEAPRSGESPGPAPPASTSPTSPTQKTINNTSLESMFGGLPISSPLCLWQDGALNCEWQSINP